MRLEKGWKSGRRATSEGWLPLEGPLVSWPWRCGVTPEPTAGVPFFWPGTLLSEPDPKGVTCGQESLLSLPFLPVKCKLVPLRKMAFINSVCSPLVLPFLGEHRREFCFLRACEVVVTFALSIFPTIEYPHVVDEETKA